MRLRMQINPDYPGIGTRYVSDETTTDILTGELRPLLELTGKGDVLQLSFVRPAPGYTLNNLLDEALCFAKANGYVRVELEDDAHFSTKSDGTGCIHRALFQRAFEGKRGIYESKGWLSTSDTGSLIAVLSTYTIGSARELFGMIRPSVHNELLYRIPVSQDGEPFGRWINAQRCEALNHFYTSLMLLCLPSSLKKLDISPASREFLQSLYSLKKANEVLYKESACVGSVRRKSSSARRSGDKRRKTRSGNGHRTTSSRHRRH